MLFPKSDDAGFRRGGIIVVCGKSRRVKVAATRSGAASWRRVPLDYRGRSRHGRREQLWLRVPARSAPARFSNSLIS